ncbi:MAG: hypothetical protein DWC06_06990 [Candidatus Poseidoniales archaeon]|nr:MAG: hypothetical protein DWC06_06990 [Candidatus Poseidoniales archaeon]
MIPLIGGAIGLFAATVNAVGIGATAGMGYGLGRKYGRKMCEFAETMESRMINLITTPPE